MCLICFLQNRLQANLRVRAQLRSDRFEQTLMGYKESFIYNFKKYATLELCKEHEDYEVLNSRLKRVNTEEIENIFEELHKIYINWINAESQIALEKFTRLLEEFNILGFNENIEDMILFRGRIDESSLSHWDMFHIPFNKRYFIKNQRYSLPGQPLLYLALSPYGIFKELNLDIYNEKNKLTTRGRDTIDSYINLKISSFRIDKGITVEKDIQYKEFITKNVFDFRNKFNNIAKEDNLNKNSKKHLDTNIEKMFATDLEIKEPNQDEEVRRQLFKSIISFCCTFRVQNSSSNMFFIEEYVLPQLLAQILKIKKKSGIIYSSSKAYEDLFDNKELNVYVEKNLDNIALFTSYDFDHSKSVKNVYDRQLYNLFNITTPLAPKDGLASITPEIFNLIYEDAKKYLFKLSGFEYNQTMGILSNHMTYLNSGLESYYDQMPGRLHIIMIFNILSEILYNNSNNLLGG